MHPNFKYFRWNKSEKVFKETNNLPSKALELFRVLEGSKTQIRIFSSGSTSKPKETFFNKEQILASISISDSHFRYKSNQKVLLCLPVDKTGGLMAFARALVYGQHIYHSGSKTEDILASLKIDRQFFMTSMVPLQLHRIRSQNGQNLLRQIEVILIGGAGTSPSLEKWLESHKVKAQVGFGMTETLSHFAMRDLNQSEFTVLDGVEISVENQHLKVSSAVTRHEAIISDDLIEMTGDDKFRFLGRFSNIINSGGFKFYPEELESQIYLEIEKGNLSELKGKNFYLEGQKDEILGQSIVMNIESPPFDLGELHAKLKSFLPKYAAPKSIIFLSQFKRTATGKIIR